MKKILFIALLGLFAATSCMTDDSCDANTPAWSGYRPAVDATTISPLITAEPTAANVGTEITLTGVCLDNVSKVTVGGYEAVILGKSFKTLRFTLPAGEFPQSDDPIQTTLEVFGDDPDQTRVFTKTVFVKVPLTDAIVTNHTPLSGTVGTVITLTGRNLAQLTSVSLGTSTITSFTSRSETEIVFPIPVASPAYTAGQNLVPLKFKWGSPEVEETIDSEYEVLTPNPTVETTCLIPALLGGDTTIVGSYLQLLDSAYFDGVKLSLMSQSPTAYNVKFPASATYSAATGVVTGAITGYYGSPAQAVTLWSDFKLDVTPSTTPVTPPVMTSYSAQDGGTTNDSLYLKKELTITGSDLDVVDSIKIGGFKAAIKSQGASSLVCIVPDDFTFNSASTVAMNAYYDGGTEQSFGNVKVFPFYYWTNISVGAQDVANSSTAFFLPDSGRVYSTDNWRTLVDPFSYAHPAPSSSDWTGATMTAANTLNKTVVSAADYNAAAPYVLITFSSGDKGIAFISPGNSLSQLRNFYLSNGSTRMTGYGTGTPVVKYGSTGNRTSAVNVRYTDSVRMGNITNLLDFNGTAAGSGAPKYKSSPASDSASEFNLTTGVLVFQYFDYNNAVYKTGFIYVKSCTDMAMPAPDDTLLQGTASTMITFDMYWPKNHK